MQNDVLGQPCVQWRFVCPGAVFVVGQVDAFNGNKERDVIQIIDKQTLEIVKVLRPNPGKVAAHTEFTRDGKYALVSIWEDDGALVIYDAHALQEVKRIAMKKPSGKYNVYNKIARSAGTSH